jgi:hypothetical protein
MVSYYIILELNLNILRHKFRHTKSDTHMGDQVYEMHTMPVQSQDVV